MSGKKETIQELRDEVTYGDSITDTVAHILDRLEEAEARVAALEGDCQSWTDKASEIAKRHVDSRARELSLEKALKAAHQPRPMDEAPVREWVYLLVKAKSRSEGNILWLDTDNNFITSRNRGGWLPYTPTPEGGKTDKKGTK